MLVGLLLQGCDRVLSPVDQIEELTHAGYDDTLQWRDHDANAVARYSAAVLQGSAPCVVVEAVAAEGSNRTQNIIQQSDVSDAMCEC